MKRIEVFVPIVKCKPVVEALKKTGVTGITIHDARGQGKGARPIVSGLRGTAKFVAEFSSINSIVTVVDDSQVDQVIAAIVNAAGTGSHGDGKIFISTIDETVDIGTNRKGISAL